MTATTETEELLALVDLLPEWERLRDAARSMYDARDSFLARLDPDEHDDVLWCERCGTPGTGDDFESTNGGDYACGSCIDGYYQCVDCEERFTETTTALGGAEVCPGCLETNWSLCNECDGWYHNDDTAEHEHAGCACEAPAQRFTVRNDGCPPLENDERVTVALAAGHISAEGLAQISAYLRAFFYAAEGAAARHERAGLHDLAYSMSVLGDQWQTKQGNFTKRLSHLAYTKHNNLKLGPEMLSRIGCIASDNSTAVDFEVEVTRDLNLSATDFYHGGSCWWLSYSDSRCALKTNGGFGLRTFVGYQVTGRAWVMPLKLVDGQLLPTFETFEPDAFMVFNGYGALSGYIPARIVGHMAGLTYRKIGFTCSPMYVNGDSGYLVASEEIAHEYTDGRLRLDVDQHSELHTSEMKVQDDDA